MKTTDAKYTRKEFDRKAFYTMVYEVVKLIPPGRVTSYGAIAAAIGRPSSSRRVGAALAVCGDYNECLPAYRVVSANGVLIGKDGFSQSGQMQRLLEEEGVQIKNNKVQHLGKVFWNPLNEVE
jgi:methylated-DNA-protein-cysteine methyltransferase-like protein